jgi:hypothetical protein
MNQRTSTSHARRGTRSLLAACLVTSGMALAACGGGSKSSSPTATASKPATSTGARPPASGNFAALTTCLKKHGITLPAAGKSPQGKPPQGKPPQGAPSGAAPKGGGFQLPKGVSQSQLQAALKACGSTGFARGAGGARPQGTPSTGAPTEG